MSAKPIDKEQIFNSAAEIADPAERSAFLDRACGDDAGLRAEIEALLRHDRDAGSFLERPLGAFVATIASGQLDTADESSGDVSLDFLQPSDKPGCLGTLGPYGVVEMVGRGGMGLVLRAHDPKLNRVVAIKVMAPELAANAMAVKRFLREAQAAAAVVHDHVVTIHAINDDYCPGVKKGSDPDCRDGPAGAAHNRGLTPFSRLPFIVMEFIDGQSLQDKIDRTGSLQLVEILRIGMQTAAGLSAAHEQGLVHRDIKPANILLENGVERVKLTDFGLARAVDDVSVTQTGQIAGTPQYMSPEQAQGHAVDHRSDLFSLGSVLYTMCAGRPPFRAETAVAMLRRVTDDTPRPLREVNREIPDWLEAIIAKLLAKDPAERFQTAEEVSELLSQHLAHLQHPTTTPLPRPVLPPVRRMDFQSVHPGTERRFEKPSYEEMAAPARKSILVSILAPVGPVALVAMVLLGAALAFWNVFDRGTLVIESDDETVPVVIGKPLRDTPEGGFSMKHLARATGSTEVSLRSGAYRVMPDARGFIVTPGLFVLGRGERVVVKVLRVSKPDSESPAEPDVPAETDQFEVDPIILDSDRRPRRIDIIAPDGSGISQGILKFDDHRLKLAMIYGGHSPPTDFSPSESREHISMILEKVSDDGQWSNTQERVDEVKQGPPSATSVTQHSNEDESPVARLLGKPVTRRDCQSQNISLGPLEVGLQALVVAVLEDEYSAAKKIAVAQEDIDAFIARWQDLQRQAVERRRREIDEQLTAAGVSDEEETRLRSERDRLSASVSPSEPPFDSDREQERLDNLRKTLADETLPWLDRVLQQRAERRQLRLIESKSWLAAEAYSQLLPLRCQRALYEQYGGKVIAMQLSINPIGAYAKLIREAEQDGRLEFLDDEVKQAFWRQMDKEMKRPEIRPDAITFRWPGWMINPSNGNEEE